MFQIRALASPVRFFGLMKIWTLADLFPSATGKAYLVPYKPQVKKIGDHDPFLPLGTAVIVFE
jgi:hypothetical protein